MTRVRVALLVSAVGALPLVLGGCPAGSSETTYVAPGTSVTTSGDGSSTRVEVRTEEGTFVSEGDGARARFTGPDGSVEIDGSLGIDALGVPVPDGARVPADSSGAVSSISTPQGRMVTASLETTLKPDEVLDFYAKHVELSMRTVMGDSAIASGTLKDGGQLTISLTELEDGKRTLVLTVTRETK